MKQKKIRILFIYPVGNIPSFIRMDLEILKRHFDVKLIQWTRNKDIKNIINVTIQIIKNDLTYIWFAGGHACSVIFLSKIFKKRTNVVVGGYEVANEPGIDYGLMISPESSRKVKYVLKNADRIVAVSEFSKREILSYLKSARVRVIYNGVDTDKFIFISGLCKDDLIITVGSKMQLKGLNTFIESAKLISNKKFLIIGLEESLIDQLMLSKPENVELKGIISHEDIIEYYQKAKVYCQLSYRESFGMSLAEAMACECIPVVTNRGALPEVVGDTGFYVPYGDPKATAEAIKKALLSNQGNKARERIQINFSSKKREKELVNLIRNSVK